MTNLTSHEIPVNPRVPCVAKRGKDCWLLQFTCVWCGKSTHTAAVRLTAIRIRPSGESLSRSVES